MDSSNINWELYISLVETIDSNTLLSLLRKKDEADGMQFTETHDLSLSLLIQQDHSYDHHGQVSNEGQSTQEIADTFQDVSNVDQSHHWAPQLEKGTMGSPFSPQGDHEYFDMYQDMDYDHFSDAMDVDDGDTFPATDLLATDAAPLDAAVDPDTTAQAAANAVAQTDEDPQTYSLSPPIDLQQQQPLPLPTQLPQHHSTAPVIKVEPVPRPKRGVTYFPMDDTVPVNAFVDQLYDNAYISLPLSVLLMDHSDNETLAVKQAIFYFHTNLKWEKIRITDALCLVFPNKSATAIKSACTRILGTERKQVSGTSVRSTTTMRLLSRHHLRRSLELRYCFTLPSLNYVTAHLSSHLQQ